MTTFSEVLDDVMRGEPAARRAPAGPAAGPALDEIHRMIDQLVDRRGPSRRPPWAIELDVDLPCDPPALRRAFRRRALATHPDRAGGSHEAFLRVARALDEALAAVSG